MGFHHSTPYPLLTFLGLSSVPSESELPALIMRKLEEQPERHDRVPVTYILPRTRLGVLAGTIILVTFSYTAEERYLQEQADLTEDGYYWNQYV